MTQKDIAKKLREILDKHDTDTDGFINRKRSSKHQSDIELLLEHVSLLVADLKFEAHASRNEMFEIRQLLE